jgi:MFS family permease
VHFVKSMRSLGPRYLALWIGQTISQFGNYIAIITVPLLILHIQEASGELNTLDFALAYAADTAPTLLIGLAGGVLLDRIHLRPVMIATDLLRACAFFYLAAGVGSYGVGTVFAMAFIVGSMTTLFDAALYAMIPALVPKERLSDANSFVTASIQATFALGPLVGGLLTYLFATPAVGLFVNGATFILSAWTLKYVGTGGSPGGRGRGAPVAGLRGHRRSPPDLAGAAPAHLHDLGGRPQLRHGFHGGHLRGPGHRCPSD